MNEKLKIVIFSKNRPMQLYALLESFYMNCLDPELAEVHVLAKVDDEYLDAYDSILSEFATKCEFIYENCFFSDISRLILFDKKQYLMFLVDDIIFKNKFSLAACTDFLEKHPECMTFSPRLGLNLPECYSLARQQNIPHFYTHENDIFMFSHERADGDYGYPISLDGNIFETDEIIDLIFHPSIPRFKAPNTMESKLWTVRNESAKHYTACFSEPILFNVPDNCVQTEIPNRHEKPFGHEHLFYLWKQGLKIDISKLQNLKTTACHFPVEFEYVKR